MELRIGHGYDYHRLKEGCGLLIGGILIECDLEAIAHSDGDAVLHAVTDAILAAIGADDLGSQFPDSDEHNASRNSSEFLQTALDQAKSEGWKICNVSITVQCDEPKLSPRRNDITKSLEFLIGSPVHIKGKTFEGSNPHNAIEVHVVTLVQRDEK